MRGIFSLRARYARFLRRLRAFFDTSTDLMRAHSKIMSSEIAGPALFFAVCFRRSDVRGSLVAPTSMPSTASPPRSTSSAHRTRTCAHDRTPSLSAIRFDAGNSGGRLPCVIPHDHARRKWMAVSRVSQARCALEPGNSALSVPAGARRGVALSGDGRVSARVGGCRGSRSFLGRRPDNSSGLTGTC